MREVSVSTCAVMRTCADLRMRRRRCRRVGRMSARYGLVPGPPRKRSGPGGACRRTSSTRGLPNRYTTDCGPEGLRPAADGGPASIGAHRPAPVHVGMLGTEKPPKTQGMGTVPPSVATCRMTPASDRKPVGGDGVERLSGYRSGGLPKEDAALVGLQWSPEGGRVVVSRRRPPWKHP